MRDTAGAVGRVPGHLQLGPLLFRLFARALDENPGMQARILRAVSGGHDKDIDPSTLGATEQDLEVPRRWLQQ
eukprot:2924806-Pyramimonas_sp.AAC.1